MDSGPGPGPCMKAGIALGGDKTTSTPSPAPQPAHQQVSSVLEYMLMQPLPVATTAVTLVRLLSGLLRWPPASFPPPCSHVAHFQQDSQSGRLTHNPDLTCLIALPGPLCYTVAWSSPDPTLILLILTYFSLWPLLPLTRYLFIVFLFLLGCWLHKGGCTFL